jgi:hypothetical protein
MNFRAESQFRLAGMDQSPDQVNELVAAIADTLLGAPDGIQRAKAVLTLLRSVPSNPDDGENLAETVLPIDISGNPKRLEELGKLMALIDLSSTSTEDIKKLSSCIEEVMALSNVEDQSPFDRKTFYACDLEICLKDGKLTFTSNLPRS